MDTPIGPSDEFSEYQIELVQDILVSFGAAISATITHAIFPDSEKRTTRRLNMNGSWKELGTDICYAINRWEI